MEAPRSALRRKHQPRLDVCVTDSSVSCLWNRISFQCFSSMRKHKQTLHNSLMACLDDRMKPSATCLTLIVCDFRLSKNLATSGLDCSNLSSGLLDNFMEPFSNFRFHFLHTAQLFCGSHFSVSTTGKNNNPCYIKRATFNHNQCLEMASFCSRKF